MPPPATRTSRSARPTSPSRCAGPGDITTAGKRATLVSLGPGQSDTYTISGSNPNAGPLDAFTILDTLPLALTAVQDGQPNVTGTGTPPQVSYGPNAGTSDPGADRRTSVAAAGGPPCPASAAVIAGELRHRAGRVLGQLPDPGRHPGQRPRPGGQPHPGQLAHPQLRHGHRDLGRHARHASVVVHRPDGRAPVRPVLARSSPRSRSWRRAGR